MPVRGYQRIDPATVDADLSLGRFMDDVVWQRRHTTYPVVEGGVAGTALVSRATALSEIREGAVAPAARDDAQGRFVRGDAVGFAGGEVVSWGGAGSTLSATIERVAQGAEIVTVIEGEAAPIPLSNAPISVCRGASVKI